jgi:hypothetical protein
MGLQIEDNCSVHSLLFADDQIGITTGAEDANYIGGNWKKNPRNGYLK